MITPGGGCCAWATADEWRGAKAVRDERRERSVGCVSPSLCTNRARLRDARFSGRNKRQTKREGRGTRRVIRSPVHSEPEARRGAGATATVIAPPRCGPGSLFLPPAYAE